MKKHLHFCLLAGVLALLNLSYTSCIREPEIITETIIETDTLIVTNIDTLYLTVTDTLTLDHFVHDTATTFILLRHAETSGTGTDPVLSVAGQARAETLRRIMSNVPLAAIYSTNFNRTLQTAQPTAMEKMLSTTIYNSSALSPFVDGVLAEHHGGTVMVLGHSNTTPALLNVLVGANIYSTFPDTEYDNLFIVTVFEKGRAEVLHLKY